MRDGERGPDARRRPKAAGEAYFLYVEPAAEGANEADGPLSASRALQEAAESAAVVEERLAAVVAARVEGLDLADEDRVIAARVGVDDGAFELGQRLVDDGQAEPASMRG